MSRLLACLLFCAVGWGCGSPAGNAPAPPADSLRGRDSLLLHGEDIPEPTDPDDPGREDWQKPEWVMAHLGDISAETVADIGAGTGYFTFRLAKRARKVIALDIEQEYLDYISRRAASLPPEDRNIETRLTPADAPALTAGETGLVLLVNTYAYLEQRTDYFRKVAAALKPGGRLVVIDFRSAPPHYSPEKQIAPAVAEDELRAAGFTDFRLDTTGLPYQFWLECRKKSANLQP